MRSTSLAAKLAAESLVAVLIFAVFFRRFMVAAYDDHGSHFASVAFAVTIKVSRLRLAKAGCSCPDQCSSIGRVFYWTCLSLEYDYGIIKYGIIKSACQHEFDNIFFKEVLWPKR